MKRKTTVFLMVIALLVISVHGFAEYNREVVVQAMRTNGALMGELKTAAAREDYFAAAEALIGIAQNERSLLSQNPPKGSKTEWDRIHSELIKAAFKGIGACGEENLEKLNMHNGEISALRQEGHKVFR